RRREPRRGDRAREERHASEQHAARAEAIHENSGDGLHHTGHAIEDARHEAERDPAHVEFRLEQWEQGREGELEEVTDHVTRADERDDPDVVHVSLTYTTCPCPPSRSTISHSACRISWRPSHFSSACSAVCLTVACKAGPNSASARGATTGAARSKSSSRSAPTGSCIAFSRRADRASTT